VNSPQSPPPPLPSPAPSSSSEGPTAQSSGNASAVRLPIIRLVRNKSGTTRLIAIYQDHMLMGVCPRSYSLSERMLTVEGEADLTAQVRRVRRVSFDDVSAIKIHPGTFFYYFTLRVRSGNDIRFSLVKDQSGHVSEFLRARLGERVPVHRLWAGRTTSTLVTVLGVFGGLEAMNLMHLDQRVLGALVGVLALGLSVAGLWLLFGGGSRFHSAHWATKVATARHAVLVAKPPLRSKPLGWTLKFLGLAYWFILLSPLTDPFREWLNAQMDAQPQTYIWTLLWFPAPLLIFTGYRLCQQRYVPKQSGDPRKPILFLRPFQDDEHTSLQPIGMTAKATGIRAQSMHSRRGQTDIFDLLWSAHPIRVLRMIADYGAGSSEESIARFFERHGPVIAIGKPGEHLASPGAARMYLNDANWQDAVLCEMERAQAVVIQPAPSEGVRWELSQIREKVPPSRVLMCLISYWNNPESFEELTGVVAETLRVDLPRAVPYLRRPAFVYFDENWNPHLQELSYKDPLLWPVTSDGADLKYSLAPFVEGMQAGRHQLPRPARWIGGPKNWAASLAAMTLGTILLVVPNALVVFSGQAVKLMAAGKPVFSMFEPESVAQSLARSPRVTLQGHAVPYRIEVPEDMSILKPDNAMIEHWRRSPDSHFELQIVADAQPEDLSTLARDRLQANQAGALAAQLDSERQVDENGVHWQEARITVNFKAGVSVQEIARGTSSSRGTVLIIIHIFSSPDSDSVYRKMAEEALQSFRFEDSAASTAHGADHARGHQPSWKASVRASHFHNRQDIFSRAGRTAEAYDRRHRFETARDSGTKWKSRPNRQRRNS
jgi:hypothetical protein